MANRDYPERNRLICETLVKIGIDPDTVMEDGMSSGGYFKREKGMSSAESVFTAWASVDAWENVMRAIRSSHEHFSKVTNGFIVTSQDGERKAVALTRERAETLLSGDFIDGAVELVNCYD